MVSLENCLHCGKRKRLSQESLYFLQAEKELELELCADCRAHLLAEDDIAAEPR